MGLCAKQREFRQCVEGSQGVLQRIHSELTDKNTKEFFRRIKKGMLVGGGERV